MSDFKFSILIQQRYADFDMLGHLNNATYVTYYEVARIHYFSDLGWPLKDATNVVAHFDIDFLIPILPDSKVLCSIKTISLGSKSFQMQYSLTSADGSSLFSRAHSVQVCIDRNNGKAIIIPANVRELLSKYDEI
jgi:acyl-CoA thioester hydrolase